MSVVWTDLAYYRCPACALRIEVHRIQPFHERLGWRRGFGCPHCARPLVWARGPARAFALGQWIFVAGFPMILVPGAAFVPLIAFGLGGLLMSAGMLLQRLKPDPLAPSRASGQGLGDRRSAAS